MPRVHVFKLVATFGAEQVFRALRLVCDHPAQRDFAPDFQFDWIARRVSLSANSPTGLEECTKQFLGQVEKMGAEGDSFLPAVMMETDGRYSRNLGVTVQDPATIAEVIGAALVDLGLRGIQVYDAREAAFLRIRVTPLSSRVDYPMFIKEFPVPSYMSLTDEGVQEMEAPAQPVGTGGGRKGKKKK